MLNVHVAYIKNNDLATYYYALIKEQKNNFKKAVKKYLAPVLEEIEMEPKLSATILDIIFHWRKNRTITHTNYLTHFGIREAAKEQNKGLGWTNFVLGRWSPK